MPIHGTLQQNLFIETEGRKIKQALFDYSQLKKYLEKDIEQKKLEAQKDIAKIKLEAQEEGFRKGLLEGFDSLISIEKVKNKLIHDLDCIIHKLVSEISEEVIAESLKENSIGLSIRIKRTIRQVLENQRNDHVNIAIRMSPDDILDVKNHFLQDHKNIIFKEDSSLMRGETILETSSGFIEIRPIKHLKSIINHISKIKLLPKEKIQDCENQIMYLQEKRIDLVERYL